MSQIKNVGAARNLKNLLSGSPAKGDACSRGHSS